MNILEKLITDKAARGERANKLELNRTYVSMFQYNLSKKFETEKSLGVLDKDATKRVFLSESIFNFTLYDYGLAEAFALRMLEVIQAIFIDQTLAYLRENEEQRLNYFIMVNMPFLADKLTWGMSIRNATFSIMEDIIIEGIVPHLSDASGIMTNNSILVKDDQLDAFMFALLEWVDNDS